MGEATVTLSKNVDNTYTSMYPSGDKPNSPFAYKNLTNPNQTPTQGDIIVFSTDGTYNFGADFPILVGRFKEQNMTAGTTLTISTTTGGTIEVGSKTTDVSYTSTPHYNVVSDSSMPWGKCVQIGSTTYSQSDTSPYPAMQMVTNITSSKIFSHNIYKFPSANQANWKTYAEAEKALGKDWNLKVMWNMLTAGGYDAGVNSDLYTGAYYAAGGLGSLGAIEGAICVSNDTGNLVNHAAYVTSSTSACNPNTVLTSTTSTDWRSTPLIQQNYQFIDTSGKVEQRLIDTGVGVIYDFTQDSVSKNTAVATNNGVDRVKITSECKGYYIDVGANELMADTYTAYGEGAPCRVEISDGSTPTSVTRTSICTPLYWTNTCTAVRVEKGLFWNESLSGRYFHKFNKDNQLVASVPIS